MAGVHFDNESYEAIVTLNIDGSYKFPRDTSAKILTSGLLGEQYVGIIYKDWPVFIGEGQRTSYAGDVLAIVVADTKLHARAAAALVDVEYDVLRPITDAVAAITDPEVAVYGTKGNVLSVSAYQRGNTDAALASSAHVVHEVFQTQRIEHAFLEPESTLAVPSRDADGRRHLHVAGCRYQRY